MDPTEARSTAMTMRSLQPNVSRTTERANRILWTATAWIPLAHCGDLPSLYETEVHLIECADDSLERMPRLVALAYSLGRPHRDYVLRTCRSRL